MNIVSVVTGTVNRLKHLQEFVASVRYSIGARVYGSFIASGIGYEIIIVDGGSTDGTLEWCKAQPDVKLIEHGKLLGAVKAFNDGAKAAVCDYVILANDDVIFINESILSAIAFMQLNPTVGIGCFYQDRYKQDWHVEQMPAIKDGRQVSWFYGQVCIVPRVLGDKVGWWGDYLRTYGGDNELSCNVLELGYDIKPIPCACIHDSIPNDDLRKENNEKVMVKGKHPDTEAFVKKWTRVGGKKGPIIGSKAGEFKFESNNYIRCLYAPIYEPGYDLQHKTKRGLRNALAKRCLVAEVDYVREDFDYVFDVAKVFKPHLILTQIQSVDDKVNAGTIAALKLENPHAKFVNWNGDYHPEHLFSRAYIEFLRLYDYAGFCTDDVAEVYNKQDIRWGYWQIGYEETRITKSDYSECNVVFLGNGYSEARQALITKLYTSAIRFQLYGIGWPMHFHAQGNTLYDFDEGAKIYSKAKMTIGDSQWPRAGGYVSNRLFQALDAGVLLLQQRFDGMEQHLGLRDGEHLVVWDTVDDLMEKIQFFLKHTGDRKRIALTGQNFIHTYHAFDNRVNELFGVLKWM